MDRFNYVCSNPACGFTKSTPTGKSESLERYCPLCSKDLMLDCPECGEALRNEISIYCSMCGKPIKPLGGEPDQENRSTDKSGRRHA